MLANNEVDLLLYGELGEGGWWDQNGSKEFARQLTSISSNKQINVRINSYGGEVFTGIAMHSMLKSHGAKVVTVVEGIAASAASLVAMAGSVVKMSKGAMLMIHNPASYGYGDMHEMRKQADMLDKVRESLIPIYSARTGLEADELVTMLDAETWLTADEAVKMGFAYEIEEGSEVLAQLNGNKLVFNGLDFDVKNFKNMPVFNKITEKKAKETEKSAWS